MHESSKVVPSSRAHRYGCTLRPVWRALGFRTRFKKNEGVISISLCFHCLCGRKPRSYNACILKQCFVVPPDFVNPVHIEAKFSEPVFVCVGVPIVSPDVVHLRYPVAVLVEGKPASDAIVFLRYRNQDSRYVAGVRATCLQDAFDHQPAGVILRCLVEACCDSS